MNSTVREKMVSFRRGLDRPYVLNHSEKIIKVLSRHPNLLASEHILFYHPTQNEVDLLPLGEDLIKKGKTIYFPVTEQDKLMFYSVTDLEAFKMGYFGIMEPTERKKTFTHSRGVALVPGVAFTKDGRRIGFGKGYYDRFLAKHTLLYKIGICYENQIADEIEVEPWDVNMDEVIYG